MLQHFLEHIESDLSGCDDKDSDVDLTPDVFSKLQKPSGQTLVQLLVILAGESLASWV
jgi:hypothetical protein